MPRWHEPPRELLRAEGGWLRAAIHLLQLCRCDPQDPDLTNRGREEARLGGQLLKAASISRIEVLYTSLLKRAVKVRAVR